MSSKYTQAIDSMKAPEQAIEKAVAAIHNAGVNGKIIKLHKKKRAVSAIAAGLAAALALTAAAGAFTWGGKNSDSFVLKTNAAELSAVDYVNIGELRTGNNAQSIALDKNNKAVYISQIKVSNFPVVCGGNDIEKVTYTFNGNGYFMLPDSSSNITDKVSVPTEPNNGQIDASPYYADSTHEGNYERLLSYTTSFDAQSENQAELALYVEDYSGEYCELYNSLSYTESGEKDTGSFVHGQSFGYEEMYYNLFTEHLSDYAIDVTASFADGTTETKTIVFEIEKGVSDTENEAQTFTVKAKLAD